MGTKAKITFRILIVIVLSLVILAQITGCESAEDRERALWIAANNGRIEEIEEVERLLRRGTDPNAKNESGATALMRAAHFARSEVVKLLIEYGADVNAKTDKGKTALFEVVLWDWEGQDTLRCRKEIVELLIASGADVNARTIHGSTPVAACAGNEDDAEILRILLENGAVPSTIGYRGWTPLMEASMVGTVESVRLLIEYGADLDVKQDMGESALSLAAQHCHPEIVEVLLKAGASTDFDVDNFLQNPPFGIFALQRFSKVVYLLEKAGVEIDFGLIPTEDVNYAEPLLDEEDSAYRDQVQSSLQFPLD